MNYLCVIVTISTCLIGYFIVKNKIYNNYVFLPIDDIDNVNIINNNDNNNDNDDDNLSDITISTCINSTDEELESNISSVDRELETIIKADDEYILIE